MPRYIFIEVDQHSDLGYNKAVEVYKITKSDCPVFVAGNYALSSAAWAGYRTEARKLIAEHCGHKLPDGPYRDFGSKNVQLFDLRGGPGQ